MDRYSAIIAMTSIIVGGALLSTLINAVFKIAMRRKAGPSEDGGLAGIEDRLARMEQAIDAVAVEVERISEGQRFTTKLLSERREEVPVHRNLS